MCLGLWICTQNATYELRKCIMTNENIRQKWNEVKNSDKYKKYLSSSNDKWLDKLDEIKKYIDDTNKLRMLHDANKQVSGMCHWILNQKRAYKTNSQSMKNPKMHALWTEFISDEKFSPYFIQVSQVDRWKKNFEEVKDYVKENNSMPSQHAKDKNIRRLDMCIVQQRQNYKNKNMSMKNKTILKIWTNYINDQHNEK